MSANFLEKLFGIEPQQEFTFQPPPPPPPPPDPNDVNVFQMEMSDGNKGSQKTE